MPQPSDTPLSGLSSKRPSWRLKRRQSALRDVELRSAEGEPALHVEVLPPRWARRGSTGRFARRVAGVAVALSVFAPTAAVSALAMYLFVPLPLSAPDLPKVQESKASVVLAADGSVITAFKPTNKRVILPAEQIPQVLRHTIVAIEDRRFYQHRGIDLVGILRAAGKNLSAGKVVEGGSTITQQLVKNLTGETDRTFSRKVEEAAKSLRLDEALGKEQVLTMYLNTVYFGEGAFGAEAASQEFFHKDAGDLTLSEAAMLSGLVQSPSRHSPRVDLPAALRRWSDVLTATQEAGFATPDEITQARANPPQVFPRQREAEQSRYGYFSDFVKDFLVNDAKLTPEQLYGGGLVITTSLDPALQSEAEASVRNTLYATSDPSAAVVTLDPATGAVLAMVGGRDYAVSQVNLATGKAGGGSGRQVGSSFKPFVLAEAYRKGMSPRTTYNAPASIQPAGFDKPVFNAEPVSFGRLTLDEALVESVNTVFVQLINDAGVRDTAELARAMGVTSLNPDTAPGGIALGVRESSPLEMATAYATLARGGSRMDPTPVLSVTDQFGKPIWSSASRQAEQVLEPNIAGMVVDSMVGVVERGTGTAAGLADRTVAGKTGTTNDCSDAWFVGFVPQRVTAVWVGYPQSNQPMRNVHGVPCVYGGTFPARIFQQTMSAATAGLPALDIHAGWASGYRKDGVSFDRSANPLSAQRQRSLDPNQSSTTPTFDLPDAPTTTSSPTTSSTTTSTTSTTRPPSTTSTTRPSSTTSSTLPPTTSPPPSTP